jgi:hypothetical protein
MKITNQLPANKGELRKKIFSALFPALFILCILFIFFFPIRLGGFTKELLAQNIPQFAHKIQFHSAQFSLAKGFCIKQLQILHPEDSSLLVSVPELYADFSIWPLLRGTIQIKSLHADFLHLNQSLQMNPEVLLTPIGIITQLKPILSPKASIATKTIYINHPAPYKAATQLPSPITIQKAKIVCKQCDSPQPNLSIRTQKVFWGTTPLLQNTQIQSTLFYKTQLVSLTLNGSVRTQDGSATLQATLPISLQDSATFIVQYQNIDMEALSPLLKQANSAITGTLSGQMSGSFLYNSLQTINGMAAVQWKSPSLRNLPFMHTQAYARFLPGFTHLAFDDIQADSLPIRKGKIILDSLNVRGDRLHSTIRGYLRYDGKLYLILNGSLPKQEVEKLPSLSQLAMRNQDGSGTFSVVIAGDLQNQTVNPTPKQVRKAADNSMQKMSRGLRKLFSR